MPTSEWLVLKMNQKVAQKGSKIKLEKGERTKHRVIKQNKKEHKATYVA